MRVRLLVDFCFCFCFCFCGRRPPLAHNHAVARAQIAPLVDPHEVGRDCLVQIRFDEGVVVKQCVHLVVVVYVLCVHVLVVWTCALCYPQVSRAPMRKLQWSPPTSLLADGQLCRGRTAQATHPHSCLLCLRPVPPPLPRPPRPPRQTGRAPAECSSAARAAVARPRARPVPARGPRRQPPPPLRTPLVPAPLRARHARARPLRPPGAFVCQRCRWAPPCHSLKLHRTLPPNNGKQQHSSSALRPSAWARVRANPLFS